MRQPSSSLRTTSKAASSGGRSQYQSHQVAPSRASLRNSIQVGSSGVLIPSLCQGGAVLSHYWAAVAGNIEAMPLQAVITVLATLLLRKHVTRWSHRLVGEKADIEDVRRMAESARRIAAA